ncbi:uncharacterized protein LOC123229817 [Mangifera indica]|uniref:uncharacterized protein LOC123229817 n=1 Tax=Mangifera indica TaxID=29780 RepID=UPI001CFA3A5E|nr:uncharacterized protein LOC123229817 [Mangifera indica]
MVEKANKKHKKGFISEADISSVLQRYTANTVLALLQEVAQSPGVKLDWNALVKKTSTGISNAREYQMLWRHLAYRNPLLEKLEDGAQPLDDDSDLECELEAFPDVSSEALTEAAACVKVLIASGLATDSNLPNSSTVEAPLTINIPNGQSFRASLEHSQPACLMQGTNITVPVSVQKMPLPMATTTEGINGNGSVGSNMHSQRKRKTWTPVEDAKLIAGVQKYGEGKWANILEGDVEWDRNTSQLCRRWNALRRKNGNMISGANSSGSQLSETQLATRHAMSLALDMPVKNITSSTVEFETAGVPSNPTANNSGLPTSSAEALPGGSNSFVQAQSQSQQVPNQTKSSPVASPGSAVKSQVGVAPKKIPAKTNYSTDSSLRAAAVAAGARIVIPSDATSLLKVAQGKNAIHIMSSGVSSIKPSITGGAPVHSDASTVRYTRMGLAAASPNAAATSGASQPSSVKAASPRVQQNTSSEQINAVKFSPAIEPPLKPEVKAEEGIKVSDLSSAIGNEPSKEVQADVAAIEKLKEL